MIDSKNQNSFGTPPTERQRVCPPLESGLVCDFLGLIEYSQCGTISLPKDLRKLQFLFPCTWNVPS